MVDLAEEHLPPEGLDEAELDRHFSRCAKEWIRRNPGAAAKLYALKTANYFHFNNKLSTAAEESFLKDLVLAATYYPLLLAGIVRLLLWRRYRLAWPEALLYLLYSAMRSSPRSSTPASATGCRSITCWWLSWRRSSGA